MLVQSGATIMHSAEADNGQAIHMNWVILCFYLEEEEGREVQAGAKDMPPVSLTYADARPIGPNGTSLTKLRSLSFARPCLAREARSQTASFLSVCSRQEEEKFPRILRRFR